MCGVFRCTRYEQAVKITNFEDAVEEWIGSGRTLREVDTVRTSVVVVPRPTAMNVEEPVEAIAMVPVLTTLKTQAVNVTPPSVL